MNNAPKHCHREEHQENGQIDHKPFEGLFSRAPFYAHDQLSRLNKDPEAAAAYRKQWEIILELESRMPAGLLIQSYDRYTHLGTIARMDPMYHDSGMAFFDALLRYYREQGKTPILSCPSPEFIQEYHRLHHESEKEQYVEAYITLREGRTRISLLLMREGSIFHHVKQELEKKVEDFELELMILEIEAGPLYELMQSIRKDVENSSTKSATTRKQRREISGSFTTLEK